MRIALALFFAAACVASAQTQRPATSKRISSVTWDLSTRKLAWEVQSGRLVDGEFRPSATAHYEITPDDAVMQVLDERRGFSEGEARSLRRLLDTLSLYCAESVVWWNQGQGEKLDEAAPEQRKKPRPAPEPTSKPERVSFPVPASAPVQVAAAAK